MQTDKTDDHKERWRLPVATFFVFIIAIASFSVGKGGYQGFLSKLAFMAVEWNTDDNPTIIAFDERLGQFLAYLPEQSPKPARCPDDAYLLLKSTLEKQFTKAGPNDIDQRLSTAFLLGRVFSECVQSIQETGNEPQ